MANYPTPREIPDGKVLIAEYYEKDAPRAVVEKIAEAPPRADLPIRPSMASPVYFIWSSPGFEPAGSCMRWTNGFWGVHFYLNDGTRHGRRYRPDEAGEAEAREHFRRLTEIIQ